MNITLPGKAATLMASQRERAEKQRAAAGIEARSWYRITNAADPEEAELLLYDEIGGWFGCTADQLIADLRGITAPRMRVRVNSPGGSVFEGIAIANALRAHAASVTVQVDGIAASIASVIAMAGDRIEMAPNSMMMIHDASGVCLGNAADMAEMGELLDLISDNIADAYASRAGGTRAEWRDRMRSESWFLPDDAVSAGLADEAIAAPKTADPGETAPEEDDEPDMARAFDLAAFGYAGPKPNEPAGDGQTVSLTFNVGDSIDEAVLTMLRQLVATQGQATPVEPAAEPQTPPEPEPAAAAAPVTPEPATEPPPAADDTWAQTVAHLTRDDADDWSALVSRLTSTPASSRAATEA